MSVIGSTPQLSRYLAHMKKLILMLSLVFCTAWSFAAQDYSTLIRQANNLAKEKAYEKALEAYKLAFSVASKSRTDLYNAACVAALAGDQENAFAWLNLSIDNGWVNIEHMKKDSDFLSLHGQKKWHELLASLQKKIDFLERNYDKALQKELLARIR